MESGILLSLFIMPCGDKNGIQPSELACATWYAKTRGGEIQSRKSEIPVITNK